MINKVLNKLSTLELTAYGLGNIIESIEGTLNEMLMVLNKHERY